MRLRDGSVCNMVELADLNEKMKKASGGIMSEEKLVCFFYLLMRDHFTPGKVETIMVEVETSNPPWEFTNGWLALHAKDLSERLK